MYNLRMPILVDTHKIYSILVNAGFEQKKATALVEAFSSASDELSTKADIARIEAELKLIKWIMTGIGFPILVGIVLLLFK